jgi:uncharacterized membrane protein YbhN (UPF0104 family)
VALLVARKFSADAAGDAFSGVNWPVVAAVAAADVVATLAAAVAWTIGLRAAGMQRVERGHVIAAHWIGSAVGSLAPAQLTDPTRLMVLRRHMPAEPGRACRIAGSMAAQHILRGAATFALVVVLAIALPMPGPLGMLRWLGPGLVLVGLLVLAVRRLRPTRERRRSGLRERIERRAHSFLAGGALLRRRSPALWAFGFQFLAICARFGALVAGLEAFGIAVPLSAAVVVFAVICAGDLIPSGPGGLGVRQAAIAGPLAAAYGVGAGTAVALSLGMQVISAAVAVTGGLVALAHQRRAGRPVPVLVPAEA